jgi:hypothetical protein
LFSSALSAAAFLSAAALVVVRNAAPGLFYLRIHYYICVISIH